MDQVFIRKRAAFPKSHSHGNGRWGTMPGLRRCNSLLMSSSSLRLGSGHSAYKRLEALIQINETTDADKLNSVVAEVAAEMTARSERGTVADHILNWCRSMRTRSAWW